MSFLGDLVQVIDQVVDSLGLQSEVTHFHWTSQDSDGKPVFSPASGTKRKAAWEKRTRIVAGFEGRQVTSTSSLIFPRPVVIGVKDQFTLPDGALGLVVSVSGFADPETKEAFATEVFLG